MRFQSIIQCLQQNQCVDQINGLDEACAADFCGMELAACGLSLQPPSGMGTCSELFACFGRCPMDNQQCQQDCINNTSEEGFAQAQAVSQCAQAQCPNGATNECVQENCPDQWVACFGEPVDPPMPMGEGTCNELLMCLNAMNDPAQCVEATSVESYALFTAIVDCSRANMCMTAECEQMNCAAEFAACTADGAE